MKGLNGNSCYCRYYHPYLDDNDRMVLVILFPCKMPLYHKINQTKCSIVLILFCFSSKLDGCLVTLVHNDSDVDDEESLLLWKQLCYVAHMELHVRGLSSGYCKDVHGQVRIKPMIEFLF